jgi:hypothetical protein
VLMKAADIGIGVDEKSSKFKAWIWTYGAFCLFVYLFVVMGGGRCIANESRRESAIGLPKPSPTKSFS